MSVNWIKYVKYDYPAPTQEDRKHFEDVVGQKMPQFYWNIIRNHQGDIPDPDFFIAPETNQQERFGVLLHIFEFDRIPNSIAKVYSVLSRYEFMCELYSSEIVPISNDTGGNNIALDFRFGPDPYVVFIDHNIEGDEGITLVAKNIGELFKMFGPYREQY